MAEEVKEYLDYDGLTEYDKKSKELFQDLTIQDVEEAFNELDESDPSYSAFYDVIQKAKEATANADSKAAAAVTATNNANTATSKADAATERANKAAEKLETVNDMTTGINLLRGTRDFQQGTKTFGTESDVYVDGYNVPGPWKRIVDESGFTYFVTSNEANVKFANSAIFKVRPGEQMTLSFNFMVKNLDVLATTNDIATIVWRNETGGQISQQYVNVKKSELISNEWKQLTRYFEVPQNISYATFTFRCPANCPDLYYKMPIALFGHINNPIYSVNPADLALEPINDITTGINLLRGTRDLPQGIIKPGDLGLYKDGCYPYNKNIVRGIDDDGFSYVAMKQSSGSSYFDTSLTNEPISSGETITVEFMFKMVSKAGSENIIAQLREYFIEPQSTNSVSQIALTDYGLSVDTIEVGKWYRFVRVITATKNYDAQNGFLYLEFRNQNSSSEEKEEWFKKPLIYKGRIEHPEWSASPFDLAQITDLTTCKEYDIASLLTPESGWTIKRALLFVSARRNAQIFIEASCSNSLPAFASVRVCKYDEKIIPVVSTSVNVGDSGSGWMNSGELFINVTPFRTINANASFHILATYILRKDFVE